MLKKKKYYMQVHASTPKQTVFNFLLCIVQQTFLLLSFCVLYKENELFEKAERAESSVCFCYSDALLTTVLPLALVKQTGGPAVLNKSALLNASLCIVTHFSTILALQSKIFYLCFHPLVLMQPALIICFNLSCLSNKYFTAGSLLSNLFISLHEQPAVLLKK